MCIRDSGQADRDLLDARIERTRGAVDTLQQLDLLGAADHVQRVVFGIQLSHLRADESLDAALLAGTRDGTRRLCGLGQGVEADRVAVGEAGLLTGPVSYTHLLWRVLA